MSDNHSTHADRDLIRNLNGICVSLLDENELESLDKCIKDNYAIMDFSGINGLLGLPKVKITYGN